MKWNCTVRRMQEWHDIMVEAETEAEAKDKADAEARDMPPSDGYGWSTTAEKVCGDNE